jgi:hypothetical protein
VSITLLNVFAPAGHAQQAANSTKAVQITGLTGVKNNTKGTLTVESGALRFTHSASTSDLAPNAVQDVVTGSDSQRLVGGTVGTMSMFAPYGSGRFLSLFRTKLDTLTIQYRDADGGIHGVIFTTTPVGTADVIKSELIGLGAHTSVPAEGDPAPDTPHPSDMKMSVTPAQDTHPAKMNASAITVMMIQSDEIKLPAEFQVSLYENLIQQLQKKAGFQHVYREGDRNAAAAPNLIIVHSTVRGFKPGSERARQVTTVTGETSITVHCEFTDSDGKLLLARDIKGNVRFFGGNLRATSDFAKKAAALTRENFSPVAAS